jgi:hypothetical protein
LRSNDPLKVGDLEPQRTVTHTEPEQSRSSLFVFARCCTPSRRGAASIDDN